MKVIEHHESNGDGAQTVQGFDTKTGMGYFNGISHYPFIVRTGALPPATPPMLFQRDS
jgi:hypothetical protein